MDTTSSIRIPGFHGYTSREDRSQADQLIRAHLAKQLTEQRDRLAEIEIDLLARDDRGIGVIDRAVWQMQLLIDSLSDSESDSESAEKPWSSRSKLRDEDLEMLQRIDQIMLRGADEAQQKTDEIVASYRDGKNLTTAVGDLIYILLDIASKLEERGEIIQAPLP